MIKVMIVEDDVMFRYAIRTILDWSACGFDIIGEAINGRHALQLMEDGEPELLLVDINMPEMNGIDLIKEGKRTRPFTKIIVLSNYDDFNFVKEALKYGAEDYLLKHELNREDLLRLLEQTKAKLAEERRQDMETRFLRSNFSTIADTFLRKVLNGELRDIEEIKNNISILKLKITLSRLVVILVEADADAEKRREEHSAQDAATVSADRMKEIHSLMETVAEDYSNGVVADMENGKLALVASFYDEKSEARIKAKLYEMAGKIRDYCQIRTRQVVTIGISNVCDVIANLSIYHTQAEMALESKLYEGTGKIYFYASDAAQASNDRTDSGHITDKLMEAVKSSGPSEVREALEGLFAELYRKRLHGVELKKELFEFYTRIYFTVREQGMDFKEIGGITFIPMEFVDRIGSLEEKKKSFLELLLMMNRKFGTKKTIYKKEVQKIMDFIHTSYMKDITLAEIASELNFSPNYLSNLFKQETGYRLMEYINKVRIEEAKNLLKNSRMKVYEVASRVGFSNTSYFCTVFKDVTGVRVTDYKKSDDGDL
jgi:two-component system, response regulator YesN